MALNNILVSAVLLFNMSGLAFAGANLIKYVNPFIGTDAHGHTFPGASVPFGGVQLSPDTRLTGWDGCSAYHYSDSIVYGFSHTHLSGTGCSDYGDILFAPTTGPVRIFNGYPDKPDSGYCSRFSHSNEKASPGYYKTKLDDYGIIVELTATKRCGFHKYTFPGGDESNIIIDLQHRDYVLDSYFNIVSLTEIEGFRHSSNWARDQRVYFVARFSKPFASSGAAVDNIINENANSGGGKNVKAFLRFDTKKNEAIFVKVGISAVSLEGARKNLDAEIPGWDFDKVRKDAENDWNKELSKIIVEGNDEDRKTVFYTALYHSMLAPNLFMDVDGTCLGMDLKAHKAENYCNYTVFSLWDTYRATHPLFTIIDQKRTGDFINTFLNQYKTGGLLPIWELAANETGCMIGYHSVSVIADAWLKGIRNFDGQKALDAMTHSAELNWLGLDVYKRSFCIAGDEEHESISKTLEYAYDDWCIAQMAKSLGRKDIYEEFIKRAQSYKNIFDPETACMRPKINGGFIERFDPSEVNNHFTEANSWQYSFYVPQDVGGLIKLLGGRKKLGERLDALFAADSRTTGRTQSDITGLIGQYAHGNEPSHHTAYLYNFAGEPWKTQETARLIMDSLYKSGPDGLCGNEDCGQMSSWYVLSALGFYPVCPGDGFYQLGSPVFDKAVINLENGKKFIIEAKSNSKENKYVQSIKLNGKEYGKSFITNKDIIDGSVIQIQMGNTPNKSFGSKENDISISSIDENYLQPSPFVSTDRRTFRDSLAFSMSVLGNAKIYYTLDGSVPDLKSSIYTKPLTVKKSSELKMFASSPEFGSSPVVSAMFSEIPSKWQVSLVYEPNKQYTAGGPDGLIDGIRGNKNFRLGGWQGYQAVDFEAVVDMGEVRDIRNISAGFLQDARSWIWAPKTVYYYVSDDGNNFREVSGLAHDLPDNLNGSITYDFKQNYENLRGRYVKVKAVNYGDIPEWHPGYGGKAFIFIDEIIIE